MFGLTPFSLLFPSFFPLARFRQGVEKRLPVSLRREHAFATVSAAHHMMRQPQNDDMFGLTPIFFPALLFSRIPSSEKSGKKLVRENTALIGTMSRPKVVKK